MGNANMCGCDCTHAEKKNEFDLRISTASVGQFKQQTNTAVRCPLDTSPQQTDSSPRLAQTLSEAAPMPAVLSATPNYKRIGDLVLAMWRGYQDRKAFAIISREANCKTEYFSRELARETVTSSKGSKSRKTSQYTYRNGATYTGEWRGGFRDGRGVMIWPNGAKFEGTWNWGWPAKIGTFSFPDGDTFQGPWLSPYEEGRKSLFIDSQSASLSVWKNSQSNGYVWVWYKEHLQNFSPTRLIRESMSPENKKVQLQAKFSKLVSMLEGIKERFKGAFGPSSLLKAGLRTYREQRYENGTMYMGEFEEDLKDGHGKLIYSNGDIYEGEWKADQHDGFGMNKWNDGSGYIGCYVRGMKVGVGEYHWEEGSTYTGEWDDNKMHGVGRYVWPDRREFLGEWREGLMDGYGVFQFPDGRSFEGMWLKGKKHGEIISIKDGKVTKETWRNGKVVKPDQVN